LPIDIADERKIWESVGIEVERINLSGGARVQQAFANDVIDLSVNGSTELAYRVKGIPSMAVAALAGAPNSFTIVVGPKSTIKTVDDLKGKKIAVSSAGSHTDWLIKELSRIKGWDVDGIQRLPLGGSQPGLAAMQRGDVDGVITSSAPAAEVEASGKGRVLLSMGDYVKDTHAHLLYASDKMIKDRPQVIERFLKGWFKTIAYMKANRAEGVKASARLMSIGEPVIDRIYDLDMGMMSNDGVFNRQALERVAASFVELEILEQKPNIDTLHITKFVPVKID
jgi:ABC-type nitrate/sulfonate/bicarbonate transport system substrate-binding protein